ncbi:MAG: OsmC family protein [Candidatus Cloacimonetes bacterium]|nr:OsmC family protein [Candidatus Cloacimonadota bacterium]
MKLMKFDITAKSKSRTKVEVVARDFKMTIDEPAHLGGEDHGATPVEYLLGALAGCLNVVGHMVAKEMNFDFNGLEIKIEGGLNPAKFVGKPSDERTGFQFIDVKIRPETNANPEILAEWLKKVEERCPVSDNIANATPIKIALMD